MDEKINFRTTLYVVKSYALSTDEIHEWGSSYNRDEAEQKMFRQFTGDKSEWANKYHRDWFVDEVDVTGAFVIPEKEKPRDRFACRSTPVEHGKGTWNTRACEVVDSCTDQTVGTWEYRYTAKPPFEPFRQGDRNFALISEHYTATSVMDLATGEIVAAEEKDTWGFCPVGFYVPDWWDLHDGSIKPGTRHWEDRYEQPSGQYGFVWGCVWGDDGSWKVQYLDLSKIQDGEIGREERFGYVELATIGDDPRAFIGVGYDSGTVTFAEERRYNLESGRAYSYDD